jgi:hypothetical protein
MPRPGRTPISAALLVALAFSDQSRMIGTGARKPCGTRGIDATILRGRGGCKHGQED